MKQKPTSKTKKPDQQPTSTFLEIWKWLKPISIEEAAAGSHQLQIEIANGDWAL